jgi:7,8-dihydropterin-6-yl-methyl-4-(beta-D-ribofuranosyl)aminobenzene 5'-phosphate synthase
VATPRPQPTAARTQTLEAPASALITLTIVFDNNAYAAGLETAWGFACLVETPSGTVLFDTGGDGAMLLRNLERLGADVEAIDAVVLSHYHGDHVDGLGSLLDAGIQPTVYVPESFPASFKDRVRARTAVVEVAGPAEVLPGVRTTGEIRSRIIEQALVVETAEGLVVITGCAHPGVVEMVRAAVGTSGQPVALVVGGFHLGSDRRRQIEDIAGELRELGVRGVAPMHCSGELARRVFADSFGEDCIVGGVGWTAALRAP